MKYFHWIRFLFSISIVVRIRAFEIEWNSAVQSWLTTIANGKKRKLWIIRFFQYFSWSPPSLTWPVDRMNRQPIHHQHFADAWPSTNQFVAPIAIRTATNVQLAVPWRIIHSCESLTMGHAWTRTMALAARNNTIPFVAVTVEIITICAIIPQVHVPPKHIPMDRALIHVVD